nr:MAG: Protein of unknown function (DUF459) [Bacteriophage sp.]
MSDFDKINILGTTINVKDSIARSGIENTNAMLNTTNTNLDALSNKVTKLHHKGYIFIGDSYTQGYSPDGNISNTFVNQIINNLKITDVKISANGGASFANSDNNFLTLLKNINVTDKNSITNIVVFGGYNDYSWSKTDIITGMTNFFNYAKTNYPNAIISIGYVGFCTDSSTYNKRADSVSIYNEVSGHLGGNYLSGCEYILHNTNEMSSDGIHPNMTGHKMLASYCTTALMNGSCNPTSTESVSLVPAEGWTVDNPNNFIVIKNGGVLTLQIDRNTFRHAAFTFKGDETRYLIGTFNNTSIFGNDNGLTSLTVPCYCALTGYTSNYASFPLKITLEHKELYVSTFNIGENGIGGNYMSLPVSQIIIPTCQLTCSTLLN